MVRRAGFALVLLSVLPSIAPAQTVDPPRFTISPRTGPASEGWPRDPLPQFGIPPRGTIPLPQIGLPLPAHGLRPLPESEWESPRPGHRPRRFVAPWPAVVFVPHFVYAGSAAPEPSPAPAPAAPPPAPPPAGRLYLDFGVAPANVEVFVDGNYAGVPEDFSAARGGAVIDPGTHRVDVSAPGHQAVAIEVKIAPAQSITYRVAMQPLPPPGDAAPSTFYLIPGCYMGNIPPKDARLPPTCDVSLAVTYTF